MQTTPKNFRMSAQGTNFNELESPRFSLDESKSPLRVNFTSKSPQNHEKQMPETSLSPKSLKLPIIHDTDAVKVAVRVRSFLPHEKSSVLNLCIRMKSNTCELTLDDRSKHPFTFDQCFWSNSIVDKEIQYSTQDDVYLSLGKPLINHVLGGMNASIIAYGQTGSGKTYSLYGPTNPEDSTYGLIPRVCNDIFSSLNKQKIPFKATVSMVEVYLERVYDLLEHRQELNIRGTLHSGFRVHAAKKLEVHDFPSIIKIIQSAELRKTYASTAANERSSRAHTLFELNLRMATELGTRTSRFMLVDLAGSERTKVSRAEGKTLEQACNINLSLMHLGRCIEAVGSNKLAHNNLVEFRSSALTKLLKESLGGNAKTVILATLSPSAADAHNTLHALRFADRAKKIKTHAVINEFSIESQKTMSNEIKKAFQERMDILKIEYELENKQQALLAKEIELEAQSVALNAEKAALAQQLEDNKILTKQEKGALADRERDLQQKSELIKAEMAAMQSQRQDLEEKMGSLETANAQILADKRMAQDEMLRLQDEAFEAQEYQKILENTMDLHFTEHEEAMLRNDITLEFLHSAQQLWQKKLASEMQLALQEAKTPLLAELDERRSTLLTLKASLVEVSKEAGNMRAYAVDKSNEHSKVVEALNAEIKDLKTSIHRSSEAHMKEIQAKESEINSLVETNRVLKEEQDHAEAHFLLLNARKVCHEMESDEAERRRNIMKETQSAFNSIMISASLQQHFSASETNARLMVTLNELREYQSIRELYFAHQKQIFYLKALSLTACIRSDPVP